MQVQALRYAIILSPDQATAPLLRRRFSYEAALIEKVYIDARATLLNLIEYEPVAWLRYGPRQPRLYVASNRKAVVPVVGSTNRTHTLASVATGSFRLPFALRVSSGVCRAASLHRQRWTRLRGVGWDSVPTSSLQESDDQRHEAAFGLDEIIKRH